MFKKVKWHSFVITSSYLLTYLDKLKLWVKLIEKIFKMPTVCTNQRIKSKLENDYKITQLVFLQQPVFHPLWLFWGDLMCWACLGHSILQKTPLKKIARVQVKIIGRYLMVCFKERFNFKIHEWYSPERCPPDKKISNWECTVLHEPVGIDCPTCLGSELFGQ